ncbi:MAG: MotA/TolQ/ExbB proton channel family protein [Planctomycetota bacterium]
MTQAWTQAWNVFERGGPLMWPLLALALLAAVLLIERALFFLLLNRPARLRGNRQLTAILRTQPQNTALKAAANTPGLYGRVAHALASEPQVTPSLASQITDDARPAVERFMPTLSTIITAAPLLGILGTVLGIIQSFNVISAQQTRIDLNALAGGIAEALITTGAGLAIALLTVFPYNALRTQVDRSLSRIETLAEAAAGDPKAHHGDTESTEAEEV